MKISIAIATAIALSGCVPEDRKNPLMVVSAEYVNTGVKKLMLNDSFRTCTKLWKLGDHGGLGCNRAAGLAAKALKTRKHHILDPRVWVRYYETSYDFEVKTARKELLGL